jgi:hypothetical protein
MIIENQMFVNEPRRGEMIIENDSQKNQNPEGVK